MAKKIEISTAHNIVVYAELAGLGERIMATIIDFLIMGAICYIVATLFDSLGLALVTETLVFLILVFYHLLMELFNNGRSVGKMALGLKVVNGKGKSPNLEEALHRWTFRPLDVVFSIGTLAALSITSSPRNQRLGDLMGGCTVVKTSKKSKIDFSRIEEIQKRERNVKYKKVTAFSDKDMLLVKDAITRSKKFRNQSTKKVAATLSSKIAKTLDLDNTPKNHLEFLEEVLKDYVTATR